METKEPKLIHAAIIHTKGRGAVHLLLREVKPSHYVWFQESETEEESQTLVEAPNIEEAIRLAKSNWKDESFRTLNCGFRYTLPERDEHGINALLYQMGSSYASFNGVYFDDELGCNCVVQNASHEAKLFWKKMNRKMQDRTEQ